MKAVFDTADWMTQCKPSGMNYKIGIREKELWGCHQEVRGHPGFKSYINLTKPLT